MQCDRLSSRNLEIAAAARYLSQMKVEEQLKAAWAANERATTVLLNAIAEAGLGVRYAPRGRTVRQSLLHLHHVRQGWLGAALTDPPAFARLKSREAHAPEVLAAALAASGKAVGEMLVQMARKPVVPGFERSPVEVLGYMLAHEAHHRGQIILALRLAGQPLPREVLAALWEG